MPLVTIAAIFASLLLILVLARSVFGRSLFACGQNATAAWLAGVNVRRTRVAAYVLCGAAAAIAGVLFAGFTGGPSLNMGSEFLLSSIAVVVIGGTNVAGGQASVLGTWSASLFLFLLLSMLNVYQVDPGLRNVITGVIIIAVLALKKPSQLSTMKRPVSVLAEGIGQPEGPCVLPASHRSSPILIGARSFPGTRRRTSPYAYTGGAPNACALGSDGHVYVANCPPPGPGLRRTSDRPEFTVSGLTASRGPRDCMPTAWRSTGLTISVSAPTAGSISPIPAIGRPRPPPSWPNLCLGSRRRGTYPRRARSHRYQMDPWRRRTAPSCG